MSISTFTFVVEDVFAFSGGITVFVGRAAQEPAPKVLAPCDVEVVVDEQPLGRVHLTAERTSGRRLGVRAVETRDPVDVAALRGHQCVLIYREREG